MAGCQDATCACKFRAGEGIEISGAGTETSPIVITATSPGLSESLRVTDTTTVNLTLLGGGTPSDPFTLQADSSMKLTQLTDVADSDGGPIAGDVPVWVVVGGLGHFELQAPPANPAGSVNVGIGVTGTGAAGAPIKVKVIDETLGVTTGLRVYVDTAGNLRTVAPTALSADWGDITNKPTVFPPAAHNQAASTISDPQNFVGALSVGNSLRTNGVKVTTSPVAGTAPPSSGNTAGDVFFRKA